VSQPTDKPPAEHHETGVIYQPDLARQVAALRLIYEAALRQQQLDAEAEQRPTPRPA